MRTKTAVLIAIILVAALLFAGCSSTQEPVTTTGQTAQTESSDQVADTGTASAEPAETGSASADSSGDGATTDNDGDGSTTDENFRFLVSDEVNAIEDFQNLFVTIEKIGVQQNGDEAGWTEFTPDVTEVDLKPLVGDNALEIFSGTLEAGDYNKVFVYVTEVRGVFTDELGGEEIIIKLPSSKLHISTPFTVGADTPVSFVYDLTVVKAGNSGKYLLQPQVTESGANKEYREVNKNGDAVEEGSEEEDAEEPEEIEIEGVVESMDGDTWVVISGDESYTVDGTDAQIKGGDVEVGTAVEIEGYLDEDGVLIADKVEVEEAEEEGDEPEEVEISGTVESMDGDTWVVTSGDESYTVDVTDAQIKGGDVEVGTAVEIEGYLDEAGVLIADEVEVEEVEDEEADEPEEIEIEGTVESMDGDTWVVTSGDESYTVDVTDAQIKGGNVEVGTAVEIEGYLDEAGVLIADEVEVD